MQHRQGVIIGHSRGLHARVAARVVHKAMELTANHRVEIEFATIDGRQVPATSMLAIVGLDVRPGDRLVIVAQGGEAERAAGELADFLSSDLGGWGETPETQVDDLLEEAALAAEQVFSNMTAGLVVTDPEDRVVVFNPAAELIFRIPARFALGRPVREVWPECVLPAVRSTGRGETVKQALGDMWFTVTGTPIRLEGKSLGAVAVLEDISRVDAGPHRKRDRGGATGPDEAFQNVTGHSPLLGEALTVARKAAASTSTVLIRGESGTGKELVARAIHAAGPRAHKSFIAINCAAIPAPLLESELFGHEKGAFTGAVSRRYGRFELADGGSIFLDEIGDMEINMQVKLLRVLQEREFERLGGGRAIKADVRIIAATNRNLEQMVKEGRFRDDLYWRLNVLPVFLPPLRQRPEDIPDLAQRLLRKLASQLGKNVTGISGDAITLLQSYAWPGNVREMENVIERAVNLVEGETITAGDLPPFLSVDRPPPFVAPPPGEDGVLPFAVYEKEIIARALRQCGSFRAAARALGLCHKTVAAKARKYRLTL